MERMRFTAVAFIVMSISMLVACDGSSSSKEASLRDSLEQVKSELLDLKNAAYKEEADKQRRYDDSLLAAHPKMREELDDFPGGLGSEVYICTGNRSKHFHTLDDCPSLNRCTGAIEEVELRQAIAKNRKRCKLCQYVERKIEEGIDEWEYDHREETTTD